MLSPSGKSNPDPDLNAEDPSDSDCPICLESIAGLRREPFGECRHWACTACRLGMKNHQIQRCPLCRTPFDGDRDHEQKLQLIRSLSQQVRRSITLAPTETVRQSLLENAFASLDSDPAGFALRAVRSASALPNLSPTRLTPPRLMRSLSTAFFPGAPIGHRPVRPQLTVYDDDLPFVQPLGTGVGPPGHAPDQVLSMRLVSDGKSRGALVIEAVAAAAAGVTHTDIIFVLDVSASMAESLEPIMHDTGIEQDDAHEELSKMDACKQALKHCVGVLPQQFRAALVTFNSDAMKHTGLLPLTGSNKEKLCEMIEGLFFGGGTILPTGIGMAMRLICERRHSPQNTHIIVITDGHTADKANVVHTFSLGRLELEDRLPGHANVQISTVAIGHDADSDVLQALAEQGHGHFLHVSRLDALPAQLDGLLQHIHRVVAARMELDIGTGAIHRTLSLGSIGNAGQTVVTFSTPADQEGPQQVTCTLRYIVLDAPETKRLQLEAGMTLPCPATMDQVWETNMAFIRQDRQKIQVQAARFFEELNYIQGCECVKRIIELYRQEKGQEIQDSYMEHLKMILSVQERPAQVERTVSASSTEPPAPESLPVLARFATTFLRSSPVSAPV